MTIRRGAARIAHVCAALWLAACSSDPSSGHGGPDAGESGAGGTPPAGSGGATGGTTAAGGGGTASGGVPAGSGGQAGGAPGTGGGAGAGAGGEFPDASVPDAPSASASPRQLACPPGQSYGSPLPSNRQASPVRRNFGFIEGPVWIAELGQLFFSDMDFGGGDAIGPPAVIHRMNLSGGTPSFDDLVSSGSNGLALSNDGRILAATHDVQSLSYFEPVTGARENWPLLRGSAHFNSPNDLVVRADGNVYFTDPDWQLGSRVSETGEEGVYRVTPAGDVVPLDDGFDKPNGVTLSPDEATLYVGARSGGIFRFGLDAAGAVVDKVQFAPGATDGMVVDCAGNVYVTDGDIIVFDPSGTELGRITVDRTPSNVAFGGADRKTLYVTGGDTLFEIALNVPGMPY